jgi:acyl dehydratase
MQDRTDLTDPNSGLAQLPVPLPIGERFPSAGRTLTAGECGILSSLLWTTGSMHSDREFAQSTEFGELLVAGAAVVALASGLVLSTELYRQLEPVYRLRVVAALGTTAKYRSPVRFGDTIRLTMTLSRSRPSASRPGCHVLTFDDEVLRDGNVQAAAITRNVLVQSVTG